MVTKIKLSVFGLFLCLWTFLFSTIVLAGNEEYRQCPNNETCEIGEFLFDDEYAPITSAACTLTSYNPSGTLHLDDVAMTSTADGWYYYNVTTASQTLGLYRSQVCCTYGTEYLCIDKSFDIVSPAAVTQSDIADAVWDADTASHNAADTFGENLQTASSLSANDIWAYPQRSLTSFGTLTADIWNYSSRTMSNLSSVVSSIWSSSDRTLTKTTLNDGELATKSQVETSTSDLDELAQEIQANRYLLEQLVNAPIIETFIEEGTTPPVSLQTKIQETKKIARFLSTDISGLKKQIISLNTNWDDANYKIALNEMTTASRVLGANTQESSNPQSISARINWLDQKWKSPVVSNLSTQTTSALANISSISREIKSYGKTFISKQYLDIAGEHISKLGLVIGEEGDLPSSDTLFGYIADLERISDILIRQSLELDALLQNWHEYTNGEKDRKLAKIKKIVLSVNKISDAEILLKAKTGDKNHRENLALSLQGLIDANLILLAQDSGQTLQNIWLEHGSVIFRSLVSNPSETITQTIDIKYYLPQEISPEHIIEMEDGLETSFDTEKNALFVSGEVSLKPGETKTFIVETTDVWVIPDEEIASIRKQTETLFNSLKNTSYFAQGSTIKADIEVNLDKIALLQKNNQTPELKIKSHREAMLELESAKAKLENLKTIVSSAGSIGTLFGFVGGVQAIAVWGLIIILIAGFVFLSIYLKMVSSSSKITSQTIEPSESNKAQNKAIKKSINKNKNASTWSLLKEIILIKLNINQKTKTDGKKISWVMKFILVLFVFISISLLLITRKSNFNNNLVNPIPESSAMTNFEESFYNDPRMVADSGQNKHSQEPNTGLVLGAKEEPTEEEKYLMLATIPAGYTGINVRSKPEIDGKLVSRLWVNQKVFVLQEKDGWVLINTKVIDETEAIEGWILKDFISEIEQ